MTKPTQARLAAVKEFMTTFDQLMVRTFIDCTNRAAMARGELLREEFQELSDSKSLVDALDAYCDLEYIAAGTQLALALRVTNQQPANTLAFWAARSIRELNADQLCQRGLVNSLNGLRAAIDHEANKAFRDFHGAFMAVHENNMKKMWTDKDLQLMTSDDQNHVVKAVPGGWVVYRADGKILKPPGHAKPDLARFV